tara:strand:+ start:106 stop:333 length:228 start_codon:yes stop_codon:yes gene_type:complete
VVAEEWQTPLGVLLVHPLTHVVELLAITEETSELETMLVLGLHPDMIHIEDGVIVINTHTLLLLHLFLVQVFISH